MSAPLLRSEEPRHDAGPTALQVGGNGSGWDGVFSGLKTEIERHLARGSTLGGASDAAYGGASNLPDPGEEGLQAVVQSLRDSASFRQILGTTVGLRGDRRDPDARDAAEGSVLIADALRSSDARSGLVARAADEDGATDGTGRRSDPAARQAAQRKAPQSDQMLDASMVEDDGPTLRTVLRSFVRVRRGEDRQRSRTLGQSVTDAAGEVADDGLSLGERMLDSRMLGDAVRAVITQPGYYDGDNSFSVLGHGKFDMELDLSTDLAGVTVSEMSSGASLSVPLETQTAFPGDDLPRQSSAERISIYQLVTNFVQTTTGMALTILATVLLAWLGMFKFVMWLHR